MKDVRVTKDIEKIEFEAVWGELESKKSSQREYITKDLTLTLVFMSNSALRKKFNFSFSRVFWYYLQKFNFGREDGHWAIILQFLDTFLIFANFVRS